VPILPFTSILSAYAWCKLTGNLNWQWGRLPLLIILLTCILFLLLSRTLLYVDQQEFYCFNLPLLLALLIVIFLLAYEKFIKLNWHLVPRTTVVILLIAMIWSGLMAFFYDYLRDRHHRQFNLNVVSGAAKIVSDNSILFTTQVDSFFGLIERGQIRIANPSKDDFHDFTGLVAYHLHKGNSVYAAFHPIEWGFIRRAGLLDYYKVIQLDVFQHCILSQLIEK
jgi:hypothetical protein